MGILNIVHSGDMHNRLNYTKAIELQKIASGSDLLLDSGDSVSSGNIFFNFLGESSQKLMNIAGYDAACLGNREYHFSKLGLKSKLKNADFPILSANLFFKYDSDIVANLCSFSIRDMKVFVFGISNINISSDMKTASVAAQYQTDFFKASEDMIEHIGKLDSNAVIICLSHIGLSNDRLLAQRAAGKIDMILGGHSHDAVCENIAGTYIIHSGAFARFVSKISYDCSARNLISVEKILF